MRIRLDYRRPTVENCFVGVYMDDSYRGELLLKQSELVTLQLILSAGLTMPEDHFVSTGNPGEDPARHVGA